MNITISDEFEDIKEMRISRNDSDLMIELPRKKSADDITKTLKMVAQQLTKEFYKVEKSGETIVDE